MLAPGGPCESTDLLGEAMDGSSVFPPPRLDTCNRGIVGTTCTGGCGLSYYEVSHLRIAKSGLGTLSWGTVFVSDTLPTACVHEKLVDTCEDLDCFRRIQAPPGRYRITVLPTRASECQYNNKVCTCEYDANGACTTGVDSLGEAAPVTIEVTVTDTSWCDGIDLVLE
jgi:hypothetical protein